MIGIQPVIMIDAMIDAIPLESVIVTGETTVKAGDVLVLTATPAPVHASAPLSYAWSPEPDQGQGTAEATYQWSNAGTQTVTVVVGNAAGSVPADHEVTVVQALLFDLTAYWPLGEISGTRLDAHGGFDLTQAGVLDNGMGIQGNGVLVRGTGNALAGGPTYASGDWYLDGWIRLDVAGADRTVYQQAYDSGDIQLAYDDANARLTFAFGTASVATANATVEVGVWLYVACWYDSAAGTANIELNASGMIASAPTSAAFGALISTRLGDNVAGTQPWDGMIDEVGVYARVLDLPERQDRQAESVYPFESIPAAPGAASAVLASNLIAYYPLDTLVPGNPRLDRAGTNDLVPTGNTGTARWIIAPRGFGTNFNSASDSRYLLAANPPGLTGPFTVSCWLRQYDQSPARTLLQSYDTNGNQRSIAIFLESNTIRVIISPDGAFGSAINHTFSTLAIALNTWTFFALSYDGSHLTCTLNAASESVAWANGIHDGTSPLQIGTPGGIMGTELSHLGIWDKGLTGSALEALKVAPWPFTGEVAPTLLHMLDAYWSLGESSGTRRDSVGKNHLQEIGTVGSTPGLLGTVAVVGAGNYLALDHADAADFNLDSSVASERASGMTIAAWVRHSDVTGVQTYVAKYGSAYVLRKTATDLEFIVDKSGTPFTVSVPFSPQVGQWHLAVGWYSTVTSEIGVCIDGGASATLAVVAPLSTGNTSDFTIGNRMDGTEPMIGDIGPVGMWRRKIDLDVELPVFYNAGAGFAYPFVRHNIVPDIPFSPDQVDGLALWFSYDFGVWQNTIGGIVATAGDPVQVWEDRSGNDNHASADVASNRPTRGADGLAFDGVGNRLTLASGLSEIPSDWTLIVRLAANPVNPLNSYIFDARTDRTGFSANGPLGVAYSDGPWHVQASPTTAAQTLSYVLSGTSGGEIFRDGVSLGTSTYTQRAMTADTIRIGGQSGHANSGAYTGTIAHLLMYNRALSASERSDVEQWILDNS